jgi:hypothetical protein
MTAALRDFLSALWDVAVQPPRVPERHGWIRMHRPHSSGFERNQVEVNGAYGVPTENS